VSAEKMVSFIYRYFAEARLIASPALIPGYSLPARLRADWKAAVIDAEKSGVFSGINST